MLMLNVSVNKLL